MENIILVKDLRKSFKEKVAIKNLTFEVRKGEIFGFLGPSGAGKTTTIKMLTSQLIQTSGVVKVFDKDTYSQKDMLTSIGVLTDNSGVYERLSVFENLKLFADIYCISYDSIDEVLEKVGLLEFKKLDAKKLSKGMKQRLLLARALLHKPKLLFLDEPTSSLDPGNMLEIHRLLRKVNEEGTTIFLTTHNMEEADKLCDRVAFLNDGEIVELGEPQALKLKYINNEINVILKNSNQMIKVNNDQEGAEKIHRWINEGELLSIHSQEPNLEQIFLSLTGREL